MDSARAAPRHAVDDRAASVVGHRARLEMVFARVRGRTDLVHAYAEPPLRTARPIDVCGRAYAVLVCSGPGVFGGDRLDMHVRVESGACVTLVSQAALQIHPTANREVAVLDSRFDVESDADLDCFWDPVIPFAGTRLEQRIDLRLARGSRLFWSDALMSGRAGRGESWQFEEIHHELRLRREGALTYLERYRLCPRACDPRRPWVAGSADYAGTTLVRREDATAARAREIQQRLDELGGVRAAADVVGEGLLVGRILSAHGPRFAAARTRFREAFSLPPPRR